MPKKKAAATKGPAKTKAAVKSAARAATRASGAVREKISVRELMNKINAEAKCDIVRLAGDESSSYMLRRPTGIISLDIALAGGFPASATSVIVGPDGAGKDYVLWRACAEAQKIYGDEFRMVAYLTEFKLDKLFMRNMCGLKIGFTETELDEADAARARIGKEPLTAEEREELSTEVGEIAIITGVTAEEGFDALLKFVEHNICQIAAVNSIGFLQTEAKEAVDSFKDFPQQRNEAMLLSKFMPKLSMILNRSSTADGMNETALLLVNQVRSKSQAPQIRGRPAMEKDGYQAGSGSWALKHGKAIELFIHRGRKLSDEATHTVMGREVPWEITKGKLGTHDGIKGNFDFFFEDGADIIGDLYATALSYGLFEQGGSWVTYNHPEFGFKAQGKIGGRRHLMENPELQEHLRRECFKAAGVIYRHS